MPIGLNGRLMPSRMPIKRSYIQEFYYIQRTTICQILI